MIPRESPLLSRLFATIYFILAARSELAVTWICPSAVDRFGPGDVMVVRWATSSHIASPIFRLCSPRTEFDPIIQDYNGSYDTCGSAVQSFVDASAGSYFTSLTVPNVTHETTFHLVMENSAELASSPSFSISPTAVTGAVASNPLDDPSATAPVGSFASPTSEIPYLSVAHVPPPTAAYAVPLSFVGAILLAAIGLAIRHHNQVKNEWAERAEKLDISRQPSVSAHDSTSCGQGVPDRVPDTTYSTYAPRHNLSFSGSPYSTSRSEVRSQTRQAFPATYLTRFPAAGPELPRTALAAPVEPPSRCLTSSRPTLQVNPESSSASITNAVLSDYVLPTPILSPTCLTPPDRLYVRDQADTSTSYFFMNDSIGAGGGGIHNIVAYAGCGNKEAIDLSQ